MRDERGAVMVMALAAAIFLVALLYHLVGVGRAVWDAQLLQSNVDSVAYSAAAALARGMNCIVWINLLMAFILAVLILLRILQIVLGTAIVMLYAASLFSWGSTAAVAGTLQGYYKGLSEAYDKYKSVTKPVLKALSVSQEVMAYVFPAVAEVQAVWVSRKEAHKVVSVGAYIPTTYRLPTEKGSFSELCAHAGDNVVDIFILPLPDGVGEVIGKFLGPLVEEVVGAASSFFCGSSDEMPKLEVKRDVQYPMQTHSECMESDEEGAPSMWGINQSAAGCSESGKGFDADLGVPRSFQARQAGCRENPENCLDCKTCASAQCRTCQDLGDSICRGKMEKKKDFKKGTYLIRVEKFQEVEVYEGDQLVRTETQVEREELGERLQTWNKERDGSALPPCYEAGKQGQTVGDAICYEEKRELVKKEIKENTRRETYDVYRTIYEKVVQCTVREVPDIPNMQRDDDFSSNNSDAPKPAKLSPTMKEDPNAFRLVAVSLGAKGANRGAKSRVNKIAEWVNTFGGNKADGGFQLPLRGAVAASQFLSPHWDMWHVSWYARLVRVRWEYLQSNSQSEGGGGEGGSSDSMSAAFSDALSDNARSAIDEVSGPVSKWQQGIVTGGDSNGSSDQSIASVLEDLWLH